MVCSEPDTGPNPPQSSLRAGLCGNESWANRASPCSSVSGRRCPVPQPGRLFPLAAHCSAREEITHPLYDQLVRPLLFAAVPDLQGKKVPIAVSRARKVSGRLVWPLCGVIDGAKADRGNKWPESCGGSTALRRHGAGEALSPPVISVALRRRHGARGKKRCVIGQSGTAWHRPCEASFVAGNWQVITARNAGSDRSSGQGNHGPATAQRVDAQHR